MSFDSFMQNGLRVGSLFGTDIILRPSFFLVPVLALLLGWNLAIVAAVFGFCLMHEFAHIGTGRIFGARTRDVKVYIFGMAASVGQNVRSGFKNMLIYAAGPASNFIAAAALSLINDFYPSNAISVMITVNLMLGVFNLIPIFPMDGAGILNCIMRMMRVPNQSINDIMFIVTTLAAIFVVFVGVRAGAIMALMIAGFLWVNAYHMWRRRILYLDHLD